MAVLIFLAMSIAMMTASAGHRGTAIGLFCLSVAAAAVWFGRYATDMLKLPL